MAENKTQKTTADAKAFLDKVDDPKQREDAKIILDMMQKASGAKPEMWGASIIGYGTQTYKTSDGKEHEWFKIGFSPRKANLSLYILRYAEDSPKQEELLAKLGKHSTGKSCLYIKKLEDVDMEVLEQLIKLGLE